MAAAGATSAAAKGARRAHPVSDERLRNGDLAFAVRTTGAGMLWRPRLTKVYPPEAAEGTPSFGPQVAEQFDMVEPSDQHRRGHVDD